MPVFPRHCLLPAALAVLCCSCSTPEERADAAFAELCVLAEQVRAELAAVVNRESADRASSRLEKLAESLRDVLTQLDELAEDTSLSPESRRLMSERYHAPLHVAVEGALGESRRVVMRHALYQSRALSRIARREFAHYSARGVHPWARAVYMGKELNMKN